MNVVVVNRFGRLSFAFASLVEHFDTHNVSVVTHFVEVERIAVSISFIFIIVAQEVLSSLLVLGLVVSNFDMVDFAGQDFKLDGVVADRQVVVSVLYVAVLDSRSNAVGTFLI